MITRSEMCLLQWLYECLVELENSVVGFTLVTNLIIGLAILNLYMNDPQIEALHWLEEFLHFVSQVVLFCH
jgi:hypothetical protein